ncbi:MAG: gliding motility-associated C-terminal domain-containing protein [Bacteroidota bacterium]
MKQLFFASVCFLFTITGSLAQSPVNPMLQQKIAEKLIATQQYIDNKANGINNNIFGKVTSSPEQDCNSAIPVCQNVYNTAASYSGVGSQNEIPSNSTCLGENEKNSVWYTFTSGTAGNLAFQISPNSLNDDYDFALYDITGAGCADITNGSLSPVRCNYAADAGNTGLSSSGTNASEGAGGNNQSSVYPTQSGKTYVLIISNYSSTQSGYSLDFSAGTASIFDNIAPTIVDIIAPCGSSVLTFEASEQVQCASIAADGSDFSVTGVGGPYSVTAAAGINCGSNVAQISLTITPSLTGVGPWTIGVQTGSDANTLIDACGNVMAANTKTFIATAPSASITGPSNLCSSSVFALNASSGSTYTWTGSGVPAGQENQQSLSISGLASGTYTFNVTIGFGLCGNAFATHTLSINSGPTANFLAVPDFTVCAGTPVTFSNTTTYTELSCGGLGIGSCAVQGANCGFGLTCDPTNPNHNWTFGDPGSGNNTSTNQDGAHTYTNAGVYAVVLVEQQSGFFGGALTCSSQIVKNITVLPNTPTLTASPSVTLCSGETTNLSVTGGQTYTWTPIDGLSSSSTSSTIASPTVTTIYTVSAQGCSTIGTKTIEVAVNSLPPSISITGASTVCPNVNNVSYNVTAFSNTIYSWTVPVGVTLTSSSSTTNTGISVNYTNTAGTISVTATNLCGTTTETISVAITTITVTTVPSSIVLCSGNSFTAAATGANYYNWTPTVTLSSSTSSLITGSPTVSTTYTVTGRQGFCYDTAIVDVTVVNGNGPLQVSPSVTTCPTGSVTISASGAGTYTWTPTFGIIGSSNNSSALVNPSVSTIYSVTGQGCSGTLTNTVEVTVVDPIPVLAIGSPTLLCSGGSSTLTAYGANTYIWMPNNNLSTSNGSVTVASPTSSASYTVTGSIGTCTNTSVVNITVSSSPVYTITPSSATICAGQSAALTATANGVSSYTWNPGPSQNTTTVSPVNTTTYTVTGNSSCPGQGTVAVIVNQLPQVSVNSSTICANNSTTLSVSGTAATYTWSTGSLQNTVVVNPTSTTVYTVTGASTFGCIKTQTANVTVHNPIASFSGLSNTTETIETILNLVNTSTGASSFVWQTCLGTISTASVISLPLMDLGICCIKLYAMEGLCVDSVEKCVEVIPVARLIVPNVFTPNGDGRNDIFTLDAIGMGDISISIFDRWGLKMFETTGNGNIKWDGKNKGGAIVSDGTYFYMLNATGLDGEIYKKEGTINVFQ